MPRKSTKRPALKKSGKGNKTSRKITPPRPKPEPSSPWEYFLRQLEAKRPLDLKRLRAIMDSSPHTDIPQPIVAHLLDRIDGTIRLKDGRPSNDPMDQASREFWVYHWVNGVIGQPSRPAFLFHSPQKQKEQLTNIRRQARLFEEQIKKTPLDQEAIAAGEPARSRKRFQTTIQYLEALPVLTTKNAAFHALAKESQEILGKALSFRSIKRLYLSYQRNLSVKP